MTLGSNLRFGQVSKTVQSFEELKSCELALDDAIIYDWSSSMHALAQNTVANRRIPYEEIEKTAVNKAFDGIQRTMKRGIEARGIYHEISAIDDSLLAHRTYKFAPTFIWVQGYQQVKHLEGSLGSSTCATGDWTL